MEVFHISDYLACLRGLTYRCASVKWHCKVVVVKVLEGNEIAFNVGLVMLFGSKLIDQE
jgi:hypothetical protein